MKHLKFRAFDNRTKKWLLGYEYKNLGGFSMFGECMIFGEVSRMIDDYVFEKDGRKNQDLILMQYTGLNDKNGKEIYEGDLLNISHPNKNVLGILQSSVLFKNGCFTLDHTILYKLHEMSQLGEIIGNIYENPEKLK